MSCFFFCDLQGMSEEAVRQTRSQKRALERDATPHSIEPSNSDNESKKPKLDPSEPGEQAQTKSVLAEDGQSQTQDMPKQERPQEEEEEQNRLPSPLASGQVKDDRTQRQDTIEPSSDNRTDCNDKASKVKTEPAADTRSRARLLDPKAPGGMMAAGEVKATIKVEVQTGEQPVDMSTSRG